MTGIFYKHCALPFFLWILFFPLLGQNTVGLISAEQDKVAPGYNLFFPHNQSTVFLVDNCGRLVHQWPDEEQYRPGNMVYLQENGNLVKCKRHNSSPINDPIWAGGGGATVEILSWDNQLLHSYTLNDSLFRLHHDVAPMHNGNILMITWAKKTYEEAIQAGRNPELLAQDELWSEAVLEWDPVADSIVWEWHLWDHLVQDYDPVRDNYGVVGDHPELVDINYDEHDGHPDWLHINAVDYNPVLDQLVLSVPYFNEIWVIDHSTSTEEAAGHDGGRAGKGGDLLYRWGNPAAYQRGTAADKMFFFQHDIHWTNPDALPGETGFGRFGVYNNRYRPDSSTAHLFLPAFDTLSWTYPLPDFAYGPESFAETKFHPEGGERTFSSGLSSMQVLPNGNWLICSGRWGYSYELTPDDELVWEYITPLKGGAPVEQGDTLSLNNNLTFRMNRYAPDFPGFAGKDLSPKGYIEENPNTGFCGLLVSSDKVTPEESGINIYPNPFAEQLIIEKEEESAVDVRLFNLSGKQLKFFLLRGGREVLDLSDLPEGIYFLRLPAETVKIVKVR